jgi:hypothetical protein
MSLQSIDARISKIERHANKGAVHTIFESDPDIGERKADELRATLPENDTILLITWMRQNPAVR